jgi:hypothetical protein
MARKPAVKKIETPVANPRVGVRLRKSVSYDYGTFFVWKDADGSLNVGWSEDDASFRVEPEDIADFLKAVSSL